MEGHSPEKVKNRGEIEPVDWNAIVRNSFIFSQGAYPLQTPITRWLAMGPLYDSYLDGNTHTSVKKNVSKYTEGILRGSRPHTAVSEKGETISSPGTEIDKVINNFKYELDSAFTFSEQERSKQKEIALIRIAEGLIERDGMYLLKREGRPISAESRRDKWSSFIIDFGLFHKGDGFYTWNGTAEPFKELWNDVLLVIRARHSDELKAIANKYIEKHPNLSESERLLVESL